MNDPRDGPCDEVLKNVFDAILREVEEEGFKNPLEILEFFQTNFTGEFFSSSGVSGG